MLRNRRTNPITSTPLRPAKRRAMNPNKTATHDHRRRRGDRCHLRRDQRRGAAAIDAGLDGEPDEIGDVLERVCSELEAQPPGERRSGAGLARGPSAGVRSPSWNCANVGTGTRTPRRRHRDLVHYRHDPRGKVGHTSVAASASMSFLDESDHVGQLPRRCADALSPPTSRWVPCRWRATSVTSRCQLADLVRTVEAPATIGLMVYGDEWRC